MLNFQKTVDPATSMILSTLALYMFLLLGTFGKTMGYVGNHYVNVLGNSLLGSLGTTVFLSWMPFKICDCDKFLSTTLVTQFLL